MPRAKVIAWKFVDGSEDGRWRCPYCEKIFSGKVTRVKYHILGIPRNGISPCTKVPQHIRELMQWLLDQVRNKEDIAWKFVERLGDDRWRCHHCKEEFSGDTTGVKRHLLRVSNEGISNCPEVPDTIRKLMRSLLEEAAEEESREANGQSSMEPQSRDLPSEAQAGVAEEESREGNGRFSMEPQSSDMPTQAVVAEEESREACHQFSTEPWPCDVTSLWTQGFCEYVGQLLITVPGPADGFNFNQQDVIGLNSDQQSQAGCQFHQYSTMPSPVQNSHGESMSCSGEEECYLRNTPYHEETQMNDQQIPAGESSSQCEQSRAVGNSNCLQDCNRHSQLQTPMDMDPLIASQLASNSHNIEAPAVDLQVPEATTNAIGPSSSQGTPNGAPTGASSFQYDRTTVPHFKELLPSCNEERETETSSSPLRESMDRCFLTETHVDLQFSEGEANRAGPSSSQVHQNPAASSSSWGASPITCHPPPPLDMVPRNPSSSQAPYNAPPPPPIPPCGIGLTGPSSLPELYMNDGVPMTSHPCTGNNFEENGGLKRKLEVLASTAAGIRDEIEFGASLFLKKVRMEVANWLTGVEKLRNDCTEAAREDCLPPHQQMDLLMREAEDLRRQGKGLFEARETKFSKVLEGKMVGEAFQRNTTKILEYLVGNQISRLGIHGMGGVGKTTIMEHIHNRLIEKANYGNVMWITVSKDFGTQKLQDKILKALGLGTLQETDAMKRAATLSDCLIRRGKSTIIFDDVWTPFDCKEVGIPDGADGIKLVLTTRSLDVCRQMYCQEKIKIEPLSQKEAENLFLEEFGSDVALNLETKEIVKSIVKECAGLPLAVITMARSMQGVTNVFEWNDALEKLRESDLGQTDMEKKVLLKLKFSYDSLDNHDVQQCFLSCALYPEDRSIEKFELIELFIDQGLICGLDTREKQYNRGLTILTKLENVCLLEAHWDYMKMHDLIRDMALHIMGATSMVKSGKWLTRIPSEENWTDALEKVSLMENDIGEFPLDMLPNCPKLSTLLLNNSNSLQQVSDIPDSFFNRLWGLEVLNLSGCLLTEFPNSILNLVNLRALSLRECRQLRHIPCVGKLTSLRKLDAWCCESLEEIEGLETLVNLRFLDLSETHIERLPKGTFGGLLKLQYLKVWAPIEEDITNLVALETLECCFGYADYFNKYARVIGQSKARRYDLTVNPFKSFSGREVSDDDSIFNLDKIVVIIGWSHAIVSVGRECAGIFILIPGDVQKLKMIDCDGRTSLAGMGPLKCLEELFIGGGKNLRVLWGGQDEEGIDIHDSPATTPSLPLFPSLRLLKIDECPKLKHLFGYGFSLPHLQEINITNCEEMEGIMATVASPPPCPNPAFPSLEKILFSSCDKMKRVVESEWLSHFPNLREITVFRCENIEEIIGGPPPNTTVDEIPLESLDVRYCHKMRMLLTHEWLIHLRNLQRIHVYLCLGMVEMISGAGQSQEGSMISEAGQRQGGSIMTLVTNTSFRSSISLPKLTHLHLHYLSQLKSIWEVSVTCDSIEGIRVCGCPKLKEIPLQLRLNTEDLPYIWVEDEEKWKTLTWDHPDAQAILQPYLRKEANERIHFFGGSPRSRTSVELCDKEKDFKRQRFLHGF